MSFDAQANGLYSHYNQEQQYTIKRLMLEDWKKSGTKLPTYTKLVATFIMPLKVPDEWLKKLSHQTMAKMLNDVSTPRYEFWACLHLYLIKKYQLTDLRSKQNIEFDNLGQALAAFGQDCTKPASGHYQLSDKTTLRIQEHASLDFALVTNTTMTINTMPLGAKVEITYQGVAVQQDNTLVTVLKDISTGHIINDSYMLSDLMAVQTA